MCDANVEIVHGSRCKNIYYGGDKNGKTILKTFISELPLNLVFAHILIFFCTYYFYMFSPLTISAHDIIVHMILLCDPLTNKQKFASNKQEAQRFKP